MCFWLSEGMCHCLRTSLDLSKTNIPVVIPVYHMLHVIYGIKQRKLMPEQRDTADHLSPEFEQLDPRAIRRANCEAMLLMEAMLILANISVLRATKEQRIQLLLGPRSGLGSYATSPFTAIATAKSRVAWENLQMW